jgi:DNA-binding NarL/FixJ family response regulator
MTRVAIIEDNNTMRKMLAELIDGAPGYRCVCACATSQEALLEVPKHQPDVALMDIYLPDESGIACTARLTDKMPELQVIMVTVYNDIELIFQALKAGACGYILKRFRPDEILQAIADVRAGGAPMTSEIARMLVRSFRGPSASASEVPDTNGLTSREAEILTLLAQGLSNKEIAQKTRITAGTVRNHLEHIFKKLHVRCRTEAAAKYLLTKQPSLADQS